MLDSGQPDLVFIVPLSRYLWTGNSSRKQCDKNLSNFIELLAHINVLFIWNHTWKRNKFLHTQEFWNSDKNHNTGSQKTIPDTSMNLSTNSDSHQNKIRKYISDQQYAKQKNVAEVADGYKLAPHTTVCNTTKIQTTKLSLWPVLKLVERHRRWTDPQLN